MKDIFKKSFKVYFLLFLANIMSFFLIISLNVITVAVSTENIGYVAYGTTEESQEPKQLYTHYYDQGEDTKKAEFENNGYTVTTSTVRSNPTKTATVVSKSISTVLCLIIVIAVLYNNMWKYGNNDRTAVKYKNQKEKTYKGLIVGFIANAPALLLFAVLVLFKNGFAKNFPVKTFGLLNTYLFDFFNIISSNTVFGNIAFWQVAVIILMLLIVPFSCWVAYYLGYKDIILSEKFVYKKKETM